MPPTPSTASSPTPAGSPSAASTALVGRAGPLRELDATLEDAIAGRGRVVLLSGDPGIGKTRLVEELASHTADERADVLWATCWEDEGAPAYWPWIQILRALTGTRGREQLLESAGSLAATELSRLVPELGEAPPVVEEAELDQARFRLFDAFSTTLKRVAAERPLVVVLEDLHWADESSLQLLRFVAREARTSSLLVVGTYRDAETPPAGTFVETLADVLARSVRIRLGPLTRGEVAELIDAVTGSVSDEHTTERIRDRTGGNPLFVREVCQLLIAGGAELDAVIPEGVRAVIERRMARLPQPVHELLAVASVLGPDFDIETLAATAMKTEHEVVEALERPLAARLVLERPGRGRYGFSHALVRETLYTGLPARRRIDVHLHAGRAIERMHHDDLDACAAEIAHHFIRALPEADVTEAIRYSALAAQRALEQLAYEEAAAHYRRALEILGPGGDEKRLDLLLALGEAELAGADMERARAVFEDAADLARPLGRAEDFARAALGFGAGLGGFEVPPWDQHQIDLLQEALGVLSAADSPLRAWTLARLSVALSFQEAPPRREELSRDAVAMARRVADRRALAYALSSLCDTIGGPDHIDERLRHADEMITLSREVGDRAMELLGRRFRILALLEQGEIELLDREIEAFATLATALRQPLMLWYVPLFRGMRELMRGRFEEALSRAHEAEAVGRRAGSFNSYLLAFTLRLGVSLERREAEPVLTQFRAMVSEHPEMREYPAAVAQIAWLEALCDNSVAARGELDRLAVNVDAIPPDAEWLNTLAALAELCALLDAREHARALYDRLLPYAGRFAVDGIAGACYGSIARHLGLLAAMMDRWEDSEAHFDDALAAHQRVGAPNLAAHVKRDRAAMLLARDRAGDHERAAAIANEAVNVYRALGADGQAKHTAELLAGRGQMAATDTNVLRREGDIWALEYGGRSASMKDAKGLRDVAALLAVPGRSIHVTELVTATAGEPALAANGGGEGVVLDARARTEYRARLRELEADIDEAEQHNDLERTARAREEQEFLTAELAGALGLGGRSRRLGDPVERARKAVSMRIRLALDRMASVHPTMARHLRNSVRTGTFCVYEPEQPTTWSL